MAGIGFELRKLHDREALTAPIAAVGHAAIVAAGPWMFSISAMAMISYVSAPHMELQQLTNFRLIVIYSFLISIVATAPTSIVASRMAAIAIYKEEFFLLRPLLLSALAICAFIPMLFSIVLLELLFGISPDAVIAAAYLSGMLGFVWGCMTFCTALRNFNAISGAFLSGLGLAVGLALMSAQSGFGEMGLLVSIGTGIGLIAFLLVRSLLAAFPVQAMTAAGGNSIAHATRTLLAGHHRFLLLAVGGLLGAVAVWVDKWVIWASNHSQIDAGSLPHAPIYDSAMFVASLALIPALGFFILIVETSVHERIAQLYRAITAHATLRDLEWRVDDLGVTIRRLLLRVFVAQLLVCIVAIVMAPALVSVVQLQYQQISILRVGIAGTVFHFGFLAASTLLLYFDRDGPFFLLQLLFGVVLALATVVTLAAGENYLGLGYLVASALSSVIALGVLDRTLRNLNYIVFVVAASRRDSKSQGS
jgi:polysaccharide biosynthesis protein PelG